MALNHDGVLFLICHIVVRLERPIEYVHDEDAKPPRVVGTAECSIQRQSECASTKMLVNINLIFKDLVVGLYNFCCTPESFVPCKPQTLVDSAVNSSA